MKIIYYDNVKSYKIHCLNTHCPAILEIFLSDIKYTIYDKCDLVGVTNCINCQQELWISMKVFNE